MLLAVHYRVMKHLGSLESTQEARVALGSRLRQLLRFFCALQTSRVLHNSIGHAKAWTNNCLIELFFSNPCDQGCGLLASYHHRIFQPSKDYILHLRVKVVMQPSKYMYM